MHVDREDVFAHGVKQEDGDRVRKSARDSKKESQVCRLSQFCIQPTIQDMITIIGWELTNVCLMIKLILVAI